MHSQNVVLTSTCYNFTEHHEFCEKNPFSVMWEKCALSYSTKTQTLNGSGSFKEYILPSVIGYSYGG